MLSGFQLFASRYGKGGRVLYRGCAVVVVTGDALFSEGCRKSTRGKEPLDSSLGSPSSEKAMRYLEAKAAETGDYQQLAATYEMVIGTIDNPDVRAPLSFSTPPSGNEDRGFERGRLFFPTLKPRIEGSREGVYFS